jgi:polysaccharide export outer membrane protein
MMPVAFGAAVLALAACSGVSMPSVNAPSTVTNPAEGYILESGNKVRIVVFGEERMTGEYLIDPSGGVSMPLIGNVQASGLVPTELAKRIEGVLRKADLLNDPRVNVDVITFRPFYVLGEVRLPGEFPYESGATVLSAIAKAGGYEEMTPLLPGDIVRVLERRF